MTDYSGIIAGVAIAWFSLTGLILLVIGAFLGFTTSGTRVDRNKRRLRHSDSLFRFIPTGKWTYIRQGMQLGIRPSERTWRTYSRSNRILNMADCDYRIVLVDENSKEIMPIRKSPDPGSARLELDEIGRLLGLPADNVTGSKML